MAWSQARVLQVLARHKPFSYSALLNGPVPFESLVQIIVDDQAHGHNIFVVNLGDHVDELGLQLRQSSEQVFKGLRLLARWRLVDDLVREVDVTLDQVHVVDELGVLGWNTFCSTTALGSLA